MNWSAPEFHYSEKNTTWRIGSIVVAIIALLVAILQKNILFGLFILLAEGLLLFDIQKKPRDLTYEITEEGVFVNQGEKHIYQELLGFSLFNDPLSKNYHELVLHTRGKLIRFIKILVPDELVEEMRDFLLDHLDELEYEESLMNHFSKRLKL